MRLIEAIFGIGLDWLSMQLRIPKLFAYKFITFSLCLNSDFWFWFTNAQDFFLTNLISEENTWIHHFLWAHIAKNMLLEVENVTSSNFLPLISHFRSFRHSFHKYESSIYVYCLWCYTILFASELLQTRKQLLKRFLTLIGLDFWFPQFCPNFAVLCTYAFCCSIFI